MNWYAIKIFYCRYPQARRWLGEAGIEYYEQKLIPTLYLVHCSEASVLRLRRDHYDSLMVYLSADRSHPAAIPEREVGIFRLVASSGEDGIEYLGDDKPRYHLGDLVEVEAGPYKGLQGHVVRLRKDRRLVITITGVAAIATAHIPEALLRPVPASATDNSASAQRSKASAQRSNDPTPGRQNTGSAQGRQTILT